MATIQNGGQVLACPPSANIRLYGSSIPNPKGKQRFYIFKYASRNPGIWAAKNPDKIGVFAEHSFLWSFYGGEGEIRTLDPCYGLRDFQSRALDQLGDFSKLFAFGTYIRCFHKQPLYNSMSGGKNQDIFQKKMNFFVSPRKAAKRAGFPPFSYAAMLN